MEYFELVRRYSGILLLLKVIGQVIIDTRRDIKPVIDFSGYAGRGGILLLPIQPHTNPKINIIVRILNYGYGFCILMQVISAIIDANRD